MAQCAGEAGEPRCVADALVVAIGPRAAVVPVQHPDSDAIRLAETAPSVTGFSRPAAGVLRVRLDRFGRKAEWEVADVISAQEPPPATIELDLRGNAGGSLERMLRVAALFADPVQGAVVLEGRHGREHLAIPAAVAAAPERRLTILIGPATASSAEVLAALLRRHAGAAILGERSRGKDWLTRLVPVDHDFRLALPVATIYVPGDTLAGGLLPDGPLPPGTE